MKGMSLIICSIIGTGFLVSCANTQTVVQRSYVSPGGVYYSNSYSQRYAGSQYQYYRSARYYQASYPGSYYGYMGGYGYGPYYRGAYSTYTFSYDPFSYGPGSYIHWAGYYPSW